MHSFYDEDSGINIHHNGDYSGEAILTVALAEVLSPEQLAMFPLPLLITDEYGTKFEVGYDTCTDDERVRLRIVLPARVLVAFASEAVRGAYISVLEQVDPMEYL